MEKEAEIIDVACALISRNDSFLAVRRSRRMPHPGKWEFPGGKIESGEDASQCIVREIHEELNLEVKPVGELLPVTWRYSDKIIRLIPIVCEITGGKLRLSEHDQLQWISKDNLKDVDWTDADREMLATNHLL